MARTKGAQNKLSRTAKENLAIVFVKLGGVTAMTEWAQGNPTEFYRLYSRLLPVEVKGPGDNGEHKIEVVWAAE